MRELFCNIKWVSIGLEMILVRLHGEKIALQRIGGKETFLSGAIHSNRTWKSTKQSVLPGRSRKKFTCSKGPWISENSWVRTETMNYVCIFSTVCSNDQKWALYLEFVEEISDRRQEVLKEVQIHRSWVKI